MQTFLADTATPPVVDFHPARANGRNHRHHPPQGTDLAARIFLACLALLFLALTALALRHSFAAGADAAQPRPSRTYCTSLLWDTPFPYRNCFIVPAN